MAQFILYVYVYFYKHKLLSSHQSRNRKFQSRFPHGKKLASVLDFSKAMIVSKVSTVMLRSAFSPSFGRGPCHVTSYYCHVIIVISYYCCCCCYSSRCCDYNIVSQLNIPRVDDGGQLKHHNTSNDTSLEVNQKTWDNWKLAVQIIPLVTWGGCLWKRQVFFSKDIVLNSLGEFRCDLEHPPHTWIKWNYPGNEAENWTPKEDQSERGHGYT